MKKLLQLIKEARFVFVCGNGGSAATAEHFTADLIKKGYSAICLNSNTSVITMIANDYGYEYIFSSQLVAYDINEDDLLITISCSGTSKNITEAIDKANAEEAQIYQFETFGQEKDYGKLEDKHLKFAHEVVSEL